MDLFGGFLGNDSAFGRLMTKAGTIIALNVLFAISCVPFFTIGAAAAALYYAVFEMLDAGEPVNPFLMYWRGLKTHFFQATAAWLAFVGVAALGSINLQVCAQAGGWLQYLSAGVIAVLIAAVIIMVYLFPVLAVFPGRLSEKVKLSVCAAMSRPLKLLLILLLHAVPMVVVYIDKINRPTYTFIGAFFGFALIAYVIGKMLLPQFETYFEGMEAG